MLDGSNFLKEGWLLGLKCYQFEIVEDLRFLVMGKNVAISTKFRATERQGKGIICSMQICGMDSWRNFIREYLGPIFCHENRMSCPSKGNRHVLLAANCQSLMADKVIKTLLRYIAFIVNQST